MITPKYSVDDMVIFAPVIDWREKDGWRLGFIRERFVGDFSSNVVYQIADLDGKEHTHDLKIK